MIGALRRRKEWRFLASLPSAHRGLAISWWTLLVLRALMPAAFTVLVGLLIGAIHENEPLTGPLVGLGAVIIAGQLLAPLHAQVATNLGDHLSAWLHDTLLQATTQPAGIAHLESRELTDRLAVARDFDLGMVGPPLTVSMGLITGGLVTMAMGVGQAIVLGTYRWWAGPLVALTWLSTHWLLRESTVWDPNEGEVLDAQRRAEYAYRLAVDAPAAKELRLFGLSEWAVAQFASRRRQLVELRWHATRLRQRSLRWAILVLVLGNGLVFVSLARAAASGDIGIGLAVTFAQAAVGASALAFGGVNWALPIAAQSVTDVLSLRQSMEALGRLSSDGDRHAKGLPAAELRFRDVHFGYPAGAPVLNGLDLTVPAGTSLGVVGLNGAGKTTLVKLLCRLYDPTSGTIEVDGVDIRQFTVDSWRGQLTAVFQDFVRYEMSLRDNVAPLGASDEDVTDALVAAGAKGLANLDAIVSPGYDGGTDLSGGQWQRVALARALAAVRHGARVVVLDEPTAQLDVRSESEIFERVLEATRDCTSILISHRFSTVRLADRICVIEDGQVAELGTHDELMSQNSRYRRMFELQASRFDDPEQPNVA